MAIVKSVHDKLLVEAQHRCTICHEKCFEIHHIVEQSEDGSDEEYNLIVMCPNCHQHRYHRSGEFTRDQLQQYKTNLKEQNEIEKRLLENLEDIQKNIQNKSADELISDLLTELNSAQNLINPEKSPVVSHSISLMATRMAEDAVLPEAARRAIEINYEVERKRLKSQVDQVSLFGVDQDAYQKSNEFEKAYEFVLILDHTPNNDWKKVFQHHYENTLYLMTRETHIRGDRVVLIVAESDDLQAHTDWIKRLIKETNYWLTTQGFKNIDRQLNQKFHKELEQFDAIESMKERTKNIRI
ncbi:MAG: HNH endonuclease [Nitrosopumilus sp.]